LPEGPPDKNLDRSINPVSPESSFGPLDPIQTILDPIIV